MSNIEFVNVNTRPTVTRGDDAMELVIQKVSRSALDAAYKELEIKRKQKLKREHPETDYCLIRRSPNFKVIEFGIRSETTNADNEETEKITTNGSKAGKVTLHLRKGVRIPQPQDQDSKTKKQLLEKALLDLGYDETSQDHAKEVGLKISRTRSKISSDDVPQARRPSLKERIAAFFCCSVKRR